MEDHNAWLRRGFEVGTFLLVGSLKPGLGGGIVAHNTSLSDLEGRINEDPFAVEKVVNAEILEIALSKADARVGCLMN